MLALISTSAKNHAPSSGEILRDLKNINFSRRSTFQRFSKPSIIQEISNSFIKLNKIIHSQTVSSAEVETFKLSAKACLQLFLPLCQTKHVTPYMVAHLPEFYATLRKRSTIHSTRGKLNDVYTQYLMCIPNT